jgi:hypothetical protein
MDLTAFVFVVLVNGEGTTSVPEIRRKGMVGGFRQRLLGTQTTAFQWSSHVRIRMFNTLVLPVLLKLKHLSSNMCLTKFETI